MAPQSLNMIEPCDKREHLAAILRTGVHELSWALNQLTQIVKEQPERIEEYEALLQTAERHRQAAMEQYIRHIKEHNCQREVERKPASAT